MVEGEGGAEAAKDETKDNASRKQNETSATVAEAEIDQELAELNSKLTDKQRAIASLFSKSTTKLGQSIDIEALKGRFADGSRPGSARGSGSTTVGSTTLGKGTVSSQSLARRPVQKPPSDNKPRRSISAPPRPAQTRSASADAIGRGKTPGTPRENSKPKDFGAMLDEKISHMLKEFKEKEKKEKEIYPGSNYDFKRDTSRDRQVGKKQWQRLHQSIRVDTLNTRRGTRAIASMPAQLDPTEQCYQKVFNLAQAPSIKYDNRWRHHVLQYATDKCNSRFLKPSGTQPSSEFLSKSVFSGPGWHDIAPR